MTPDFSTSFLNLFAPLIFANTLSGKTYQFREFHLVFHLQSQGWNSNNGLDSCLSLCRMSLVLADRKINNFPDPVGCIVKISYINMLPVVNLSDFLLQISPRHDHMLHQILFVELIIIWAASDWWKSTVTSPCPATFSGEECGLNFQMFGVW